MIGGFLRFYRVIRAIIFLVAVVAAVGVSISKARASDEWTLSGGGFLPSGGNYGPYGSTGSCVADAKTRTLAQAQISSPNTDAVELDPTCMTTPGTGSFGLSGRFHNGFSNTWGSCTSLGSACGMHTCSTGNHWQISTNSCVAGAPPPDCLPLASTVSGDRDWTGTAPVVGATLCNGGCKALVQNVYAASSYSNKGIWASINSSSGLACTGVEGATPTSTPSACATGKCPGTINGAEVCVPCLAASGGSTSSSCVTSAGAPCNSGAPPNNSTTTTTDKGVTVSGDGKTITTTTTTTTAAKNGSGVVTTTTVKGEEITSPVDKENPIKDFCTINPGASICLTSSIAATCGSFSCGGDAVQCAIARVAYEEKCALVPTDTVMSTLGNAGVAGTDTGAVDNPASLANRDSFAVASALDQTRWLTSTCPASISFTILGHANTLSFATLCGLLDTLGKLGVAVALISAIFIVGVF